MVFAEPPRRGEEPPLSFLFCRWIAALFVIVVTLGFVHIQSFPEKHEPPKAMAYRENGRLYLSYNLGSMIGAFLLLGAVVLFFELIMGY